MCNIYIYLHRYSQVNQEVLECGLWGLHVVGPLGLTSLCIPEFGDSLKGFLNEARPGEHPVSSRMPLAPENPLVYLKALWFTGEPTLSKALPSPLDTHTYSS